MYVKRFILNFPVVFLEENCFFPFCKKVALRASLVYIDKNKYWSYFTLLQISGGLKFVFENLYFTRSNLQECWDTNILWFMHKIK